jgi:hypothetical protein
MIYTDTHVSSIYSTFYSQQPLPSARVPATHRGRVLHLTTSSTLAQSHTD